MDPQSLLVSQGTEKLRTVVLFEREDVRLMGNGEVLTNSLSEIDRIKKKPGRFKTRLNFARDMTSDEVRSELEMNFPLLKNRRYVTIKDNLCFRVGVLSCFLFSLWQECVEKFFYLLQTKNDKKIAAVSLSYCSKCNLNSLNVAWHCG